MKQYVEVEFDGQVKQLKIDFNAIADIEERFNRGIMSIFNEQNIGLSTIRVFYWAGLKWKDRGITLERVGTMLHKKLQEGETLQTLLTPIMEALKLSGLLKQSENLEEEEGTEEKN